VSERPDYPRIRRVVTGHDANQTAKVIIDGAATNEKYPDVAMISTLMWATDSMPPISPSANRLKIWEAARSAPRRR